MKRNPYEKLRNPGVKGRVPAYFDSEKIFDKAGESLVIHVGKLDKGAYDFGYELHLKDGTHLRKRPGVGSGWFAEKNFAVCYALSGIIIAFKSRISDEAVEAIKRKISIVLSPTLDLL